MLLISISLVRYFFDRIDAIAGFFLEHFYESAQVGHSLKLVMDLEDVAISEIRLVKSTHISRKISK